MANYIIKQGDTLSKIAKDNNTTVEELVRINNISDPNKIYAGNTLKLADVVNDGGNNDGGKVNYGNKYSDIDLSKYDSGYQKSDEVITADKKKNESADAVTNYGDFAYSKDTTFNDIMDKILNREKFSYDLNGDALYQQYKDKYIQQGKMAMQDTMGQAAAMTGGYGNSYAATVGNQAYQASIENLNDIIPELYQMAYDKYNQEGQDLYNQYGMLSDDRTYDGNQYWKETEFGYGKDRDAVADEQWQKSFDEGVRQFNENMALSREKMTVSGGSGGTTGDGGVKEPEYKYEETDQTKMFKASIKTKNEFYTRGGSDKEKYGSYEKYIEGIMDKWLSAGKLTESEVATLIAHYGL